MQQWFEQWYVFSSNESFTLLQDAYFQICSNKPFAIKDIFLTFCRFIEGYDLRKSHDEEIANELGREIILVLNDEVFRNALSPYFIKASSKYKRNYYAHYKADKTGILKLAEIYNALTYMEVLILSVLLFEMGVDEETRKNAFIHDEVFWPHSIYLRHPEGEKLPID